MNNCRTEKRINVAYVAQIIIIIAVLGATYVNLKTKMDENAELIERLSRKSEAFNSELNESYETPETSLEKLRQEIREEFRAINEKYELIIEKQIKD